MPAGAILSRIKRSENRRAGQFYYINPDAKLVICGITPGTQQAAIALREARRMLEGGATDREALRVAKRTASFAGAMRSNLLRMMDFSGVPKLVGADDAADLFGSQSGIMQYTSVLRYPVFVGGENYSGSPDMLDERTLFPWVARWFAEEAQSLGSQACCLALGDKVGAVMKKLVANGCIDGDSYLGAIPHPSGANAERVKYFLGERDPADVSAKVNTATIDAQRADPMRNVARIRHCLPNTGRAPPDANDSAR